MKVSQRFFCLFLSICLIASVSTSSMFVAFAEESSVVIDLSTVTDSITISDDTIEYHNGTDVTVPRTSNQKLELTGTYSGSAIEAVIQTTGTSLPEITLNNVVLTQSLVSTSNPVTLNLIGENTVSGSIETGSFIINGPGSLSVLNDQAAAIIASDSITLQKGASLTAENTAKATQNIPGNAIEIMGDPSIFYYGSTSHLYATGSVWDAQSKTSVKSKDSAAIRGVITPFDEESNDSDSVPSSEIPSEPISPTEVTEGNSYQVELNWGSFVFIYSFGNWNTETLSYDNIGWDSSCTTSPVNGQLSNNEISITNKSDEPIYVYESFSELDSIPVSSGLTDGVRFCDSNNQNTTDITTNCMIDSNHQGMGQFKIDPATEGVAQSKSIYLLFSKRPDKAIASISSDAPATIGTISIRLSSTPFTGEESAAVPIYSPGVTSVSEYQSNILSEGLSVGTIYNADTGAVMTDITGASVIYTDIAQSSILPKGTAINIFAKAP